jgi:tRNA (guanine37-N1)-methyltransferase
MEVPEVLLSGDHAKIKAWRRLESLRATKKFRPDLLEKAELTSKEIKLLEEL